MRSLLAFGLLLTLGCGQNTPPAAPKSAASPATSTTAETEQMPPAAAAEQNPEKQVGLVILNGAGLDQLIASHRGKVVVVDAWSTSCEPCLREFPNLVKMSQEIPQDRLACISLSLDFEGLGKPEDQQAKVLRFLERLGAKFDNVLSADDADAVFKRLDFPAPPAVFVYDRDGKLSEKFDANRPGGHFTYADVRKHVDELLAKP
jgi:thiol-disulfide isomerase/thioredoxin